MINFRYHVVSLTAVFLALAIGLVVGTSALNGTVANDLHDRVNQLSKSNGVYRSRVINLTAEVKNKEAFATQVAPELLAGKLANRRVLVISMQESTKLVSDLDAMLVLGGAKITGQVEFQDKFIDPSENAALLDQAETSLNTAAIANLPTNSDGVETSSALLAAVLMDQHSTVTSASRGSIIKGYQDSGYILVNGSVSGTVSGPAEAVIFVAPQPYDDSNASTENQDLVTMVSQFRTAGPILVAAAGAAGSGNVIGAVTSDASLSKTVSTVDNVDTPEGRVAAVLALNEQLEFTRTGHYGVASSATSLLPKWPEE